jgi:hypothetical protein
MDLDKLLASFAQAASAELAQRPLVSTDDFIPPDAQDATLAHRGATQLVGTFLYWLRTRGHLSAEALRLCGPAGETPAPDGSPADGLLEASFEGAIRTEHLAESALDFAKHYLGLGPVGLAADFHEVFVEGSDLESYLNVELSPNMRERFAQVIDSRFEQLRQGGIAAWQPPSASVAAAPPAVHFDLALWTKEIQEFGNLEDLPSGRFRHAQQRYWRVADAALGQPSEQTSRELLATYLRQRNTATQEAVWRVLRTYPAACVIPPLVSLAGAIAESGDWLPTLVDLFPPDMKEADMRLLVAQINAAQRSDQLAYFAALRVADRQGSRHAAQLLKRLDAD